MTLDEGRGVPRIVPAEAPNERIVAARIVQSSGPAVFRMASRVYKRKETTITDKMTNVIEIATMVGPFDCASMTGSWRADISVSAPRGKTRKSENSHGTYKRKRKKRPHTWLGIYIYDVCIISASDSTEFCLNAK
jgi:hypothetical protein